MLPNMMEHMDLKCMHPHIRVEGHLHENMVSERGDVLRECLDALSLDKDLRTKWMKCL